MYFLGQGSFLGFGYSGDYRARISSRDAERLSVSGMDWHASDDRRMLVFGTGPSEVHTLYDQDAGPQDRVVTIE